MWASGSQTQAQALAYIPETYLHTCAHSHTHSCTHSYTHTLTHTLTHTCTHAHTMASQSAYLKLWPALGLWGGPPGVQGGGLDCDMGAGTMREHREDHVEQDEAQCTARTSVCGTRAPHFPTLAQRVG